MRAAGAVLFLFALTGCSVKPPRFEDVADDFARAALAFSPSSATAAGYHLHNGLPLDELLDDISEASFNRQRGFYRAFRQNIRKFDYSKLTPEDQADWDLVDNAISLALVELDQVRRYQHDPTFYTDTLGQALMVPYAIEYRAREVRFFHILRRLEMVPPFVEHAKRNLKASPALWVESGREANGANIALIEKIRGEAPAELKQRFEVTSAKAIAALRDFDNYLQGELSKRPAEWRLGSDTYAAKFRYTLGTDRTPQQVEADAVAVLAEIRAEMDRLAKGRTREALDRIAREHATREQFFASAEKGLAEAKAFLERKAILKLPPNQNWKVVATPEFQRGSYPVGGFNPAPALEPQLEAQYWVTPIPADWPAARVESKLREYNRHSLDLLTIHEAMPGHAVQFAWAATIEPRGRRLLRTLYGMGTYVEGWAEYAMQVMAEEGYGDPAVDFQLIFWKWKLRAVGNAILDVRLHTGNWSEEAALEFLRRETFQEEEEAAAKIIRAKRTSVQLATYFVGWRDFLRLRESYRAARGGKGLLLDFHDRVLRAGALPIPTLSKLITGQALSATVPAVAIAAPETR